METEAIQEQTPILRLKKDLRDAAKLMTKEEARFVVDLYYQIQDFRKATANQVRSMSVDRVDHVIGDPHVRATGKEPTAILQWSFDSMEMIEKEIKVALDKYTDGEETGMGRWAKAIVGIGPVLSAGLLAHIDMEPWKCALKATNGGDQCSERKPHEGGQCKRQPINTVGAIWRFCLPPGTRIATPNGYKLIENFNEGDQALAHDGKPTTVVRTMRRQYSGNMITIKVRGQLPLDVTEDHEIFVKQSPALEPEWMPARNLLPNMLIAMPKKFTGSNQEPLRIAADPRAKSKAELLKEEIAIDEDSAWFLGLFLADGSTTLYREKQSERGSSNITFALDDDREILKRAERVAVRFGATRWSILDRSKQLYFGRTSIARAFRIWFGGHAPEKRVPHFVLAWTDRALLRAFAEGYCWGDGHRNKGGMSASSASEELILGMQRLGVNCGVVPRVHLTRRNSTIGVINGRTFNQLINRYVLDLRPNESRFRYFDDPKYANRRPLLDEEFIWNPITKVGREIYGGQVFNIETVAGTYLAKNIAVHNCGLDPTVKWNKGEKRPWNAKLKVLCWLIGQSFVKVSNNEKSLYGRLYRERKQLEVQKSESGQYAGEAKQALTAKKFGKDTAAYAAYTEGKFPAGRLDLRATRYATKIFLYHFFAEAYRRKWGKEAPMPWVISHGGHTDFIGPEK